MRLATRLVAWGAVLPALLLALAFVVVGWLLDTILHRSIDEALLTQAAIESVSLFDEPGGHPHLHLDRSPLTERVRGIAPTGALYDPLGARIRVYPEGAEAPASLRSHGVSRGADVRTTTLASGSVVREIRVRVDAPGGGAWVLWLGASLAEHEQTMNTYWASAFSVLAVVALVLLVAQIRHARRIERRVRVLADHLARIRAGDLAAVPAADAHGDVIGELRDAIAETTARLQTAREAQERFLADAAHELRTPLAALRAGIDVTLRRDRDATELRESLERARAETDRLSLLATRLLDLASLRSARVERTTVDLGTVVTEAVDAVRAAAEERGLVIALTADETLVDASAMQLRQAVDNLLANAVRFAPPGSTIDVRVEPAGAGARARVVVRDRGPGVPAEERETIFAAFHRATQNGPGVGLGLAIVREVATRYDGTALVRAPADGPGAEFVVELPSHGVAG